MTPKEDKQQNRKLTKTKKRQAEKRRAVKKKLKYRSESDNENDSDDAFCLVCVESFGNSRPRKKWIRCQECQRWAHEACTSVEKSFGYVCKNCDSDDD